MKRFLFLLVAITVLSPYRLNAQAILSVSPVFTVINDTVPAYSSDSVKVWLKNTGDSTYTDYMAVGQSVQDSASTSYHIIDSAYSFIPVVLVPGDSVQMIFYNYYNIDSATRYHYDINVIVIWPIAISGGANVGDSLTFIEYIIGHEGVPEIDLSDLIHAYPNPVSHDLNLKNDAQTAIEEVRIYDTGGRLVRTLHETNILCTDDWNAGTYLLQITTKDKRRCTVRIVKQ
ncbi:MAG: T9SS type A sorting domain-containing protein [Bacteroidia bacterium]